MIDAVFVSLVRAILAVLLCVGLMWTMIWLWTPDVFRRSE